MKQKKIELPPKAKRSQCGECGGTGKITKLRSPQDPPGSVTPSHCPHCEDDAKSVSSPSAVLPAPGEIVETTFEEDSVRVQFRDAATGLATGTIKAKVQEIQTPPDMEGVPAEDSLAKPTVSVIDLLDESEPEAPKQEAPPAPAPKTRKPRTPKKS